MGGQRFAGLKHTGRVPDRNTIWIFRERLVQANVEHQNFAEVHRRLQQHGFRTHDGQIINTSIVRAPIQHNTAAEQAVVKEQAVPAEWSPTKRRQKMSKHAGQKTRQILFRLQAIREHGPAAQAHPRCKGERCQRGRYPALGGHTRP